VGESTDAARAEVLTARRRVEEERDRLEAAARAADIPARIRREPVRTLGVAAGTGFLLVGGPRRVLRRARRAIFGQPDPIPASMLPEEIDRALQALGDDGRRVRPLIEREFARYLDETAPERRERDLSAVVAQLLGSIAKPVSQRAGRALAEQLFTSDGGGFAAQLAKVRGRRETAAPATPAPATPDQPDRPRVQPARTP
jgi:hypothetical protein